MVKKAKKAKKPKPVGEPPVIFPPGSGGNPNPPVVCAPAPKKAK
jgi:hypothetical protein